MQFSPIEMIQMQVTPIALQGEYVQIEAKIDVLISFYPLLLATLYHDPLKAHELKRKAYPMIEDIFDGQMHLQEAFAAQFSRHLSNFELELVLTRTIKLVIAAIEQQVSINEDCHSSHDYLEPFVDDIWEANSYSNRLILAELGVKDPNKQMLITIERNGMQTFNSNAGKVGMVIMLVFIIAFYVLGESRWGYDF